MINTLSATPDARNLTVLWDSGETSELPAEILRREARDADSRREIIDHGEIRVDAGLTITGLFQVGSVGINVHFSDGHERAIYPFAYIRELSDKFGN
jgi:DUF971 family protein